MKTTVLMARWIMEAHKKLQRETIAPYRKNDQHQNNPGEVRMKFNLTVH